MHWQKKRHWRKVTQFRHSYFNVIFSCFLYQKTSIRRELLVICFMVSMKSSNRYDENRNIQWEVNGNKTSLNLGAVMGIGINSWECEGMELKKEIPAHL